ncbi:MAG TPA: serpin family protein [Spirillospora sp.]
MAGDAVRAANALTARWAHDACDGATTVLSGAGVWPLLALLAPAAREPARGELQEAIGIAADGADARARELLAVLADGTAATAALGVWAKAGLPVEPWWREAVPADAWGELTGDQAADQARLDAWVRRNTRDRLETMPVRVTAASALVLATALAVETTWRHPFRNTPLAPAKGPWAGRARKAAGLTRFSHDVDVLARAKTPAGPITLLTVEGEDDVDVLLCLGEPSASARDVLSHAVAAADGHYALRRGDDLLKRSRARKTPGLQVSRINSITPRNSLSVTTVRFDIAGRHDLLTRAGLFGLRTASKGDPAGHFPGISRVPLAVEQAAQEITAAFSAEGFKAAAVTGMSMDVTGAPMNEAYLLSVSFDRPFGFLVRHRPSGLVLLAGWVAEPEDWPEGAPERPW